MPATVLPTGKQADKKYYVSPTESHFLFPNPPPNSLVVDVVNEWGKQHFSKSIPYDKDQKKLDLFGGSSTSQQFYSSGSQTVRWSRPNIIFLIVVGLLPLLNICRRNIWSNSNSSFQRANYCPELLFKHCCQVHLHSGSYVQGVTAPALGVFKRIPEHCWGPPLWSYLWSLEKILSPWTYWRTLGLLNNPWMYIYIYK